MAISTLDQLVAAARQRVQISKTTTRTTVAGGWFSMFDIAGNPGAGTLAGSSTTAGVVPTDADAGFPTIATFGGSNLGYLSRLFASNTVSSYIRVFDLLWKGGAYAHNANQAVTAPPSYLSRIPGGTAADCAGQTEIWAETVVGATGNQTWTVQYTNEAGTGTRSTGAVGIGAAPTVGRCWQLPLQAGDKGVSLISNVLGGTGSAGTANILVLRPLCDVWIGAASAGVFNGPFDLGLPRVYDTSALYFLVNAPAGTSSGTPTLFADVSNG